MKGEGQRAYPQDLFRLVLGCGSFLNGVSSSFQSKKYSNCLIVRVMTRFEQMPAFFPRRLDGISHQTIDFIRDAAVNRELIQCACHTASFSRAII